VPQSDKQKIRSRLRSYERKLQKEKKEHGFYRNGAGKRYQIGAHYLLLGDDEGGTRRTRSLRMPASTRRKSRRAGRCIALAAAHQPALKVKLGGELDQAARRYQMINIKLDKCGGLTHGLEIARAAREKDLGLMVGCMCGTSLAMTPAFVVGLLCDFHDLDGPPLLKNDRAFGMSFENGVVGPPPARLWG
jgi:hypothetical protein